jgi:hypothetical protein
MKNVKIEKGQQCWFFHGDHQGKMTQGTCIEVIQLDGYSNLHYVIAVPTAMDDVLYIRDPYEVSDAADQRIGLWRDIGSVYRTVRN